MVVPGCRHRAHWCNGGQSVVPVLVQCVLVHSAQPLWCNVPTTSMAPGAGSPHWRDMSRVGRRVNMYRPDLTPHGDDAADCDKDLKFLGSYLSLGEGAFGQFSCNQAEK